MHTPVAERDIGEGEESKSTRFDVICEFAVAMPLTLPEYAQSLAERNLRWPVAPKAEPVRAAAMADPLPGIRVVLWNLYGTLIRIADGELLHITPDEMRMEIALDKTIREFNMWYSMTPSLAWFSNR